MKHLRSLFRLLGQLAPKRGVCEGCGMKLPEGTECFECWEGRQW